MNPALILDKIKQYPIVVGGAVLVILGLVLLFLRFDIHPALSQEHADLDDRWSVMQRNEVAAVGLTEHVERLTEFLEEARSHLLSPTDIAGNHRVFYQIEFNSGARITNLSPGEPSSQGDGVIKPRLEHFTSIPYRITVEGRFSDVLRFSQALHYGEHLMRVDRFDLTPIAPRAAGERVDSVRLNMVLEVLGRQES